MQFYALLPFSLLQRVHQCWMVVWVRVREKEKGQQYHLLTYANNMQYKPLRRFLSISINLCRIFLQSAFFLLEFIFLLNSHFFRFGGNAITTCSTNEIERNVGNNTNMQPKAAETTVITLIQLFTHFRNHCQSERRTQRELNG